MRNCFLHFGNNLTGLDEIEVLNRDVLFFGQDVQFFKSLELRGARFVNLNEFDGRISKLLPVGYFWDQINVE